MIKIYSLFRNIVLRIHYVICILVLVQFFGCYSFTGGAVPEHLKTMYISPVSDDSNYGDPKYKELMTEKLFEKFRSDNSFSLITRGGDARLDVRITSISDATMTIRPGEQEKERKVTVNCEYTYFDNVKNKEIAKKTLSSFEVYEASGGQTSRDVMIKKIINQLADDILLAVVSGW